MTLMMQTKRIKLCIKERQVHIVCILSKNALQVMLQGIRDFHISDGIELSLKLGGHIGHQLQLIVQLILLLGFFWLTITEVIVNLATS